MKVVVTRPELQADALVAGLESAGFGVVALPCIDIVEPADGGLALTSALGRLNEFEWLVVTSVNTALRLPADLSGAQTAVVGPSTARAMSKVNAKVQLVAPDHTSESLGAAFPKGSARVLLAQSALASPQLANAIRDKGWHVEVVEAYRTVDATPGVLLLGEVAAADAVTFTSGSSVEAFLRIAGQERLPLVVACIGPVTADVAARNGIDVNIIAPEHSPDGLVNALVAFARPPDGR